MSAQEHALLPQCAEEAVRGLGTEPAVPTPLPPRKGTSKDLQDPARQARTAAQGGPTGRATRGPSTDAGRPPAHSLPGTCSSWAQAVVANLLSPLSTHFSCTALFSLNRQQNFKLCPVSPREEKGRYQNGGGQRKAFPCHSARHAGALTGSIITPLSMAASTKPRP